MQMERRGRSAFARALFFAVPILCSSVVIAAELTPAYRTELRAILDEGVLQRADINRIAPHAARARRLHPSDPTADYAYGLVFSSHRRSDQSVTAYLAALKRQPTFLPAWKTLLRERLLREEFRTAFKEIEKLAGIVSDPKSDWENAADRNDAATFLGRIVAYLSLPDIKMKGLAAEQQRLRLAAIERRLGSPLETAFRAGRQSFDADFARRKAELESAATKGRIKKQHKTDEKLAAIKDRRKDLKEESQTLKLTAAQWKSRIEKQLKTADHELEQLQKDYRTLELTDARIARLATQNTLERGRLQTQYELRGIRGALLAQQPALLRLQQESTQYANQRLALQGRAATVRNQAQTLLVARAAAVQQYQAATGKIIRRDAVINRWNQTLKKSSLAMQERNKPGDDKADSSKLSDAAAYFPLDEKQEARRLLQSNGFTPPHPPSLGPKATANSGAVP